MDIWNNDDAISTFGFLGSNLFPLFHTTNTAIPLFLGFLVASEWFSNGWRGSSDLGLFNSLTCVALLR